MTMMPVIPTIGKHTTLIGTATIELGVKTKTSTWAVAIPKAQMEIVCSPVAGRVLNRSPM